MGDGVKAFESQNAVRGPACRRPSELGLILPIALIDPAEAAFKAFGRALDAATRRDERVEGVPSTKGMLG